MIVDEIGDQPTTAGVVNLLFHLVNARCEMGAMTLTSNRGFKGCGEIFGDNVVAAARLDRLLGHAAVIQIDGNAYRLRGHTALVADNLITPVYADTVPPKRRRGRSPKHHPRSTAGRSWQSAPVR